MINKFQQGGILAQIQQLPKEQQEQIFQAFSQWAQQKGIDLQAIQQDPQQLEQALGMFMEEVQAQKTRAAKHGAKLNYLKTLKHKCAEDEELYYYKTGGSIGCGCKKKMEDGGKTPKKNNSSIDKFKNRKQDQATKDSIAVNRNEDYEIENSRPGKWVKNKNYNSKDNNSKTHIWVPDRTKAPYNKKDKVEKEACGSKVVAKFKKHRQGGSLNGTPFINREAL